MPSISKTILFYSSGSLLKSLSQGLSFIISDLRTWRLTSLKRKTLKVFLKACRVVCRYFCCSSYATGDILLLTEEVTKKLTGKNMVTKFFQLQPKYMSNQRIKVTVYNVPISLSENIITSFLSTYGRVDWSVGFYGISTFLGYLMPNPFLYK